jgi:hypothetical protein
MMRVENSKGRSAYIFDDLLVLTKSMVSGDDAEEREVSSSKSLQSESDDHGD